MDECGVCGGLAFLKVCDCDGNVVDECGVVAALAFLKASATATATLWTSAVFVAAGIPEGECDCDGNVVDECGVCGGYGIPEGECDCDGNGLGMFAVSAEVRFSAGPANPWLQLTQRLVSMTGRVWSSDCNGVCGERRPGCVWICDARAVLSGCSDIPEGECDATETSSTNVENVVVGGILMGTVTATATFLTSAGLRWRWFVLRVRP